MKLRNNRLKLSCKKSKIKPDVNISSIFIGSAMYADADLKHCQKVIDMKTTELANQDLDKYYKALDRAIMRYHSLKLADINKIIKEYWVKTYRGGGLLYEQFFIDLA